MKFVSPAGPACVALVNGVTGKSPRLVSIVTLFAALLLTLCPALAVQLLPGVYGYGLDRTTNPGGFAHPTLTPVVIHVTNLDDSGSDASPTAHSLRAAIVASGPRIVVFDVGGTIELKGNLTIANPYITIAGQTAPSPGISVHRSTLGVTGSNVLVQHVRIRPGDRWVPGPNNHDRDGVRVALNATTPVTNVVFDHCTFNWSLDETASLWYAWDSVTYNQCLFAEPLATSIHLDEDTLSGNLPKDVESLTVTPVNFGSPVAQSHGDAVGGSYREWTASADGATLDFTLPIVAATDQSKEEHLVVHSFTGLDRAKFKVDVWDANGASLSTNTGEVFDQYASSTAAVSHVAVVNATGFTIPIGMTSLKVRVTVMGRNPASTGWKLGIDVLSLSQGHAMGPLFGNGGTLTGTYGRVAVIGSVIASIMERGPWVGSRDLVFANNVLYNRKKKFLMLGSKNWDTAIRASAVGNTFIEGPSLTTSTTEPILLEHMPLAGIQLYAADNDYNKGGGGTTLTVENEFSTTGSIAASDPTNQGNGLAGFQPLPHAQAYDTAMSTAGARPFDRDDFEDRIFSEITTGATISSFASRPGSLKHSVAAAGGWPSWPLTNAVWSAPSNPNLDPDGNGYTRVEEWVQGLSNSLTGLIAPTTTDALLATFDTFTDGNANGWTPLGNTEWSITSGAYRQSAPVEWARAVAAGTNWTNQVVQAKITPLSFNGSNRFIALLARQRDVNNFYYVTMRKTPDTIEIKKVVNGTPTVIGSSYAFTPGIGTQYTLRLEVSGTSPVILKAYLNGSLIINTQDNSPPAQLASGRAAIGTYYATADFDDFFASPLPTDVPQVMSDFDTGSTAGWTPEAPTNVWNATSGGVYHCTDNTVVAPRTVAGTNASAQTVQADVKIISTSTTDRFAAIYARYTDVNNCYYLLLRKDQNKLELKKVVGGTPTLITSVTEPVNLLQWYTLRLEVSATGQLNGYLNGVLRVSGTDNTLPAGKAALGTNLAAADFDDVIVTSP